MNNTIKKWAKNLNWQLTKEYSDGKWVYENIVNIVYH